MHNIDVQWVRDCVEEGEKLNFKDYMLDEMVPESVRQQQAAGKKKKRKNEVAAPITSSSVCIEASTTETMSRQLIWIVVAFAMRMVHWIAHGVQNAILRLLVCRTRLAPNDDE